MIRAEQIPLSEHVIVDARGFCSFLQCFRVKGKGLASETISYANHSERVLDDILQECPSRLQTDLQMLRILFPERKKVYLYLLYVLFDFNPLNSLPSHFQSSILFFSWPF